MAITLVVLLLLLPVTRVSAQEQQQQPPTQHVVQPGCRDKCGNITVPYPFGIGVGCFRDDGRGGFQLLCDDSLPVPRLAVADYGIQITGLSISTGEAQASLNATRHCYNSKGGIISQGGPVAVPLVGTNLLFSATKNRLVVLGCPNLGYFNDVDGYYVSGCMAVCRPRKFTASGSCTGIGCCQSMIPPAVDYYQPYLLDIPKSKGDLIFYVNSVTCRYVFLVEATWLQTNYNGKNHSKTDDFAVPVVLDWAVRNMENCRVARQNATTYACQSTLSQCVNSENGAGYRCVCSKGYEGNPYLDDGCKGIH